MDRYTWYLGMFGWLIVARFTWQQFRMWMIETGRWY